MIKRGYMQAKDCAETFAIISDDKNTWLFNCYDDVRKAINKTTNTKYPPTGWNKFHQSALQEWIYSKDWNVTIIDDEKLFEMEDE